MAKIKPLRQAIRPFIQVVGMSCHLKFIVIRYLRNVVQHPSTYLSSNACADGKFIHKFQCVMKKQTAREKAPCKIT